MTEHWIQLSWASCHFPQSSDFPEYCSGHSNNNHWHHVCWVLYLLYLSYLTMTLRGCRRAHFRDEDTEAQTGWDTGPRLLSYWVRIQTLIWQIVGTGQQGLCHSFQLWQPRDLRCFHSEVHRPALRFETGINFWKYKLIINRIYLAQTVSAAASELWSLGNGCTLKLRPTCICQKEMPILSW